MSCGAGSFGNFFHWSLFGRTKVLDKCIFFATEGHRHQENNDLTKAKQLLGESKTNLTIRPFGCNDGLFKWQQEHEPSFRPSIYRLHLSSAHFVLATLFAIRHCSHTYERTRSLPGALDPVLKAVSVAECDVMIQGVVVQTSLSMAWSLQKPHSVRFIALCLEISQQKP